MKILYFAYFSKWAILKIANKINKLYEKIFLLLRFFKQQSRQYPTPTMDNIAQMGVKKRRLLKAAYKMLNSGISNPC